jgi:hypothetical protein
VGGREAGGKSIPADRCLARIEKHDIVRHQAEQADKIACVDGLDPGRMHLADRSFIRSHPQPLPPNAQQRAAAALSDVKISITDFRAAATFIAWFCVSLVAWP